MGNNSAKIDSTSFGSIGEDSTVHKQASLWRQPLSLEEARRKYFLGMKTAEATEQASLVEFRALLDDPVAIKYFFDYARKVGKFYLIKCWKDIQANKFLASLHDSRVSGNLSAGSLPESVFTHIFSNDDSTELFEESSKLMQEARQYENRRDIPLHLLEELCFELLFRKIYVDFLKTDAFNDMCNQLRESYNLVHENDFEYYDKISEGAYGLVVHVKKMSTGKHYAMKIQHKALLLRHYKEDTHRMLQEMQAVACCNHPFIIGLAYAFQTPSLALMTLPLCIYGDLGILIMNSPCKRIPLPHVVFYVAEIVSALCYLHDCGLIYPDLKPANVLLNGDGHILLADFGAVADVEGIINRCIDQSATTYSNSLAVDGKKNGTDVRKTATKGDNAPSDENDKAVAAPLPLFKVYKSIEQQQQDQVRQKRGSNIEPMSSEDTANRAAPSGVDATNVESTEGEKGKPENSETGTSGSHLAASTAPNASVSDALPGDDGLGPPIGDRAKSIVGTIAYMAPEIILKFGSPEYGDITYTKAVDYWSLGVTTYAMIYGRLPFRQVKLDRLQEQLRVSLTKRKRIPYDVVFRQIFGKVTYAGIDNFGGYSYDSNASDYCGSFTLNQMQENEIIIGSFIDTLIEFNPANRGTNTGHDIPLPSANNSRHRMHNVPGAENESGDVAAGACTGNNEAFSKTTSKNSDGGGLSEPPSAETASSTSIKNHIFFRGIDFSLLDCKGITPPPIPSQIVASMRAKYSSSGLAVTGEFGNFGDSTSHVSGDSNAPASTDSTFRKGDIEPTPPPTKSGGISLIAPAITATSNNSCNGATGLSMTTGSGGSVKHFAKEHVHDGVQQGPRRTIADVLMRNNRTNWVPQSALGNAVLFPIDERSKSKSKTPVDAMQNRHGVATGFPRSAVDDGRVPSSWLRGLCSSAKDVAAYTPNAPHQRSGLQQGWGMTAPKLSAPVPASQAKNLREEDDMFTIKQVDQQHFANWYYVSPAVIDQEYNAQRLLSAPGNMGGNSQV